MDKILTVSVAAYNVERYLDENLRSFAESGVIDRVQILVVDDGSTDRTARIAAEYERRYPQSIRLIRKENGGAGSTVNCAVSYAAGRYFRIVDGDDWVDPSEFASFVRDLEECDADFVLTDYTKVDGNTRETQAVSFSEQPLGVCGAEEMFASLSPEMHGVTWKTSLWTENGIRIGNGYYTDVQYLLFPVPYAKTACYLPHNVYRYRVALDGQSMNPVSMQKHLDEHSCVLDTLISLCRRDGLSSGAYSMILRRTVQMAGTQLGVYLSFPPCAGAKNDLREFVRKMSNAPTDVSRGFFAFPSVRLLKNSAFLLYRPLSMRFRRRFGL